ncbi:site-specific integrase [Pedobacter sp. GSP4]|uniref:site-specific integrase n=1 Tax=Pedobacter sp. GSP4 TaxID=3453716 RepID=UPI003EEB5EB1
MKKSHTFSLQYYLKLENEEAGKAPLYLRISVDGKVVKYALKRQVTIKFWNQKAQRLNGNFPEHLQIRDRMRQVTNEVNTAYSELLYENKPVTAEAIKMRITGGEIGILLSQLLKYHREETGKLLSWGTMKNYVSTERFLTEFLAKQKRDDILLAKIDFRFITEFSVFLRTKKTDPGQRPCTHNTVMKHMERFQKMMGLALKFGWINKDPFTHFKRHIIQKDRDCLSGAEIERIRVVELPEYTHQVIRDMFLFCCYTGLAYNEISRLNKAAIVCDEEGEYWIEMIRQKTFNSSERKFHVLILPEAKVTLNRYWELLGEDLYEPIFPCPTNQATNRCLKIIGRRAGILKVLTFHIARHTFATTVTLERGVSIESVSHMLGHSSIRTTQVYAKVKKKKVAMEMKALSRELLVQQEIELPPAD